MSKAKSKDKTDPVIWNIPCGCSGRTVYNKDVKYEFRQYCKTHEAEYMLKHHGVKLAVNKEGKLVDPADIA